MLLVIVEHDRGNLPEAAREAITAGRSLAATLDLELHAAVVGEGGADVTDELGLYGAETVHLVEHDLLTDYGPEAWATALTQLIQAIEPEVVVSVGSEVVMLS